LESRLLAGDQDHQRTYVMADYRSLMTRFRWAYISMSAEGLAEVLAPDFKWNLHYFNADDPRPTGRVLNGLDEMIQELTWRKQNWARTRYGFLAERFAPNLVTQSFRMSAINVGDGKPFKVDAVDLYDVVDGRILTKSTYWKYQQLDPTEARLV
jgi:ketosteroid isomerase-like protein